MKFPDLSSLGRSLSDLVGSLWAQARVGLEVGLGDDDECPLDDLLPVRSADTLFTDSMHCTWNGSLTSNGLGSLDIGAVHEWDDD